MPDHKSFDPSKLSMEMSAKFTSIITKIKELDAEDMRDHGTLYKHFLFTDIRESAYGVKALAAFLIAAGFDFRMGLKEKFIRRGGKMVKTYGGDTVYLEKPAVPKGSNGFAILQSLPLWKNPLSVTTKKAILKAFNARPENVHGENLRLIVLDSKFKEGIDLFDVKYVHLVEPAIATSDLKQAVGRATRFCGQKGLPFLPRRGWPLQVFVYNAVLPNRPPFTLGDAAAAEVDAHSLMLAQSGLDLALLNLTKELTILAIKSAVDYDLTFKINNFKIEEALLEEAGVVLGGGKKKSAKAAAPATPKSLAELYALPHDAFQRGVMKLYSKFKWQSPVVKNGCEAVAAGKPGTPVSFTQTQDFVRHYLTPSSPFKGLLAWHSVGTGKTCMAVAAATTEFEKAGYTILWVTRNSLMSDVYKNIFGSVCSIPIMEAIKDGKAIPEDMTKAKRMLSRVWMPPISYRTFQNALEKKNELGRLLYAKNPTDPLRKTFLIMDEIHKLQDGDLGAAEAADFGTIQGYIHKSYTVSGDQSVRPLLMTATPISDSPRELFEILNTLIPKEADRFEKFDSFREKYSDKKGDISATGAAYFQDHAKGLISYLNREFDPTTFSQPEFHTIRVPITDPVLPTASELVAKCMVDPRVGAAANDLGDGLNARIAEAFVEVDCRAGFEEELYAIDDAIAEAEKKVAALGTVGKGEKEKKVEFTEAKKKVTELKKLFTTTKKNQHEKERQCLLANKEGTALMKQFSKITRKKKRGAFYTDFKKCFKQQKAEFAELVKHGQLRSVSDCFEAGAKKAQPFMKESEFMAEVKRRFPREA